MTRPRLWGGAASPVPLLIGRTVSPRPPITPGVSLRRASSRTRSCSQGPSRTCPSATRTSATSWSLTTSPRRAGATAGQGIEGTGSPLARETRSTSAAQDTKGRILLFLQLKDGCTAAWGKQQLPAILIRRALGGGADRHVGTAGGPT